MAFVETQSTNQEEVGKSITEQINIISNIQEILHIQRQHIEGHDSQERKLVNIRNIINDTLAMLFGMLDKMAISVSLDIPSDLPSIKGDRTRLMQVMLNVLKNSIEAIGIQGNDKAIILRASIREDLLALEVSDTGNGFDEDTGKMLFGRGFSTKPSGAGLALYNSREIVESHSGTLDITSVGPGKGAMMMIRFRLQTAIDSH